MIIIEHTWNSKIRMQKVIMSVLRSQMAVLHQFDKLNLLDSDFIFFLDLLGRATIMLCLKILTKSLAAPCVAPYWWRVADLAHRWGLAYCWTGFCHRYSSFWARRYLYSTWDLLVSLQVCGTRHQRFHRYSCNPSFCRNFQLWYLQCFWLRCSFIRTL